jgi:hypothetical protein
VAGNVRKKPICRDLPNIHNSYNESPTTSLPTRRVFMNDLGGFKLYRGPVFLYINVLVGSVRQGVC